jgi:nicotinamidase-related amidase
MSIAVARDPKTDHLLSPENSALVFIDYQPGLVDGTFSIEHDVLVNNVVAMAKAAKMYKLPVVLSTVGVTAGFQQDTIPELKNSLSGVDTIDRDTVDAWDSPDFRS